MPTTDSPIQPGQEVEGGEAREVESLTEDGLGLWTITILLSLLFVGAGIPQVGAVDFVAQRFQEVWGYPDWFRMMIGGLEFVGGIFLIIPQTAFWAALGLSVIMLGAIYTHVALGDPAFAPIPFVVLVLLGVVAYARRPPQLRGEQE